jgi:uncharacterized membrane protein
MENGVIIVLIIMVCLIIAAALILADLRKRDKQFIYVHTKTGNRYRIFQECKMKYNGKWMDAIVYVSEKDGEMYVREYSDFVLNFKRLSEWKKD